MDYETPNDPYNGSDLGLNRSVTDINKKSNVILDSGDVDISSVEKVNYSEDNIVQDDYVEINSEISNKKKRGRPRKNGDIILVQSPEESKEGNGPTTKREKNDIRDLSNDAKIQKIFDYRKVGELDEYFVKFHNRSYRSSEWVPKEVLYQIEGGEKCINKFHKQESEGDVVKPGCYYDPSYDIPEKVIGVSGDGNAFFTKWTSLDFKDCTWETKESLNCDSLIDDYYKRNTYVEPVYPKYPSPEEFEPVTGTPPSKSGDNIKPYQLEGLNFLIKAWYNKTNAILADEMGLGKTLQSLSFLYYLFREQKIPGPFLIMTPKSTLGNWKNHIEHWTDMTYLSYDGDKTSKEVLYDYEFFYPGTKVPKFHILLTTSNLINREVWTFADIHWRAIVIDEAHVIKNSNSKLRKELQKLKIDFKVLLTGTPIQNNTSELWSLLNFVNPDEYDNIDKFKEKYDNVNNADQIEQLRSMLSAIMLRRVKHDVEKSIAPLEEIIIECKMTAHQKAYYQSIYNRNHHYLSRGAHKQNSARFNNMFMELRKVCNHPYLLKDAEKQILIERREAAQLKNDVDISTYEAESLIRSSGKMILLDKLLTRLNNNGNRVLIFTQMKQMLDILEDYLVYKKYKYERLDGSTRGQDRQAGIDRFNAEDSDIFAFLLSTQAGGAGINLTTADTVIIYDSSFNPQNDIQATARCHRIGQTKDVKVYRFLTKNSYETVIFAKASKKLGLNTAVLENNKQQDPEYIERILKYGLYHFSKQSESTEDQEKYNEQDIDSIISQSTTIKHDGNLTNENVTISKAEFDFCEDGVDITDPNFWQKYLTDIQEDDDIRNTHFDMDDKCGKNFQWTKKKLHSLLGNLCRFGWGRWKVIHGTCKFASEVSETKSASQMLVQWLVSYSTEECDIMKAILQRSSTHDQIELNKRLKDDMEGILRKNANKYLQRLEILYFLHLMVSTCPNSPEGLYIGRFITPAPAEWWSETDDRLLLNATYVHGFGNYDVMEFTRDAPVNKKTLNSRIKLIINNLKKLYTEYVEDKDPKPQFSHDTLRVIDGAISKNDHKRVMYYLLNFGFTTIDEFIELGSYSHKVEAISAYVHRLLMYCVFITERERHIKNEIIRKKKEQKEIERTEKQEKRIVSAKPKKMPIVMMKRDNQMLYQNSVPDHQKMDRQSIGQNFINYGVPNQEHQGRPIVNVHSYPHPSYFHMMQQNAQMPQFAQMSFSHGHGQVHMNQHLQVNNVQYMHANQSVHPQRNSYIQFNNQLSQSPHNLNAQHSSYTTFHQQAQTPPHNTQHIDMNHNMSISLHQDINPQTAREGTFIPPNNVHLDPTQIQSFPQNIENTLHPFREPGPVMSWKSDDSNEAYNTGSHPNSPVVHYPNGAGNNITNCQSMTPTRGLVESNEEEKEDSTSDNIDPDDKDVIYDVDSPGVFKYAETILENLRKEAPVSKNSPVDSPWMVEKVNQQLASKVLRAIRFFKSVRSACDEPRFQGKELELLTYVAEHGFLDKDENHSLKEQFGEITMERIQALINDKAIKVPYYRMNEMGMPIFPIMLSNTEKLLCLGDIVYDKPDFHTQRYIFPNGYCVERLFSSIDDPNSLAWYRATIQEDAGSSQPLFKVEMIGKEHIPEYTFIGSKPIKPWNTIVSQIEEKDCSFLGKLKNQLTSGPNLFSLHHPLVQKLIQDMANVNKCTKYAMKKFVLEPMPVGV